MPEFIVVSDIPANPFIAGLTTEPVNPNPVRWSNTEPLKYFFDDAGVRAWTDVEKQAAVNAFAEWSIVTNIDFVLTTVRADADITQIFSLSDQYSGVTSAPADGINPPVIEYSVLDGGFSEINPGGFSYHTLVHEIGHVLGLYHPHSGTPFPGVPVDATDALGTDNLNQQIWTVMSYNSGWDVEATTGLSYGTAIGPMTFDIAAVQMLYGQRAAATGNTLYTLPTLNQIGTGWDTIWDTAGIDTINGAAATADVTIDLFAATLTGANAGGNASWMAGVQGGFTIANGVVVENAIGGSGNDVLSGNIAPNTLLGGAGDDILVGSLGFDFLDGEDGIDTAIYTGNQAQYSVVLSADETRVEDRRAFGDDTDLIANIENLFFADKEWPLHIFSDVATLTEEQFSTFVEMYIAYFNRAPDSEGLFFWANALSNGTSLEAIATLFFDQDETRATYPNLNDLNGFAKQVYSNVLGREFDQDGLDFWVGVLESGQVALSTFMLEIIRGAKAPAEEGASEAFKAQKAIDVQYLSDKADLGSYFSVIKGMSNSDNATTVMAAFDGSSESIQTSKAMIESFHEAALSAESGEFLVSLVGVIDDPFAIA